MGPNAMELIELILTLANDHLESLKTNGCMPGGHNGPYYDPETPVRNTAHWTTTFSFCYEQTRDKKYYHAVELCEKYLISSAARPMNAAFYCRTNPKKDFSNGLIGQAWAIEGLVAAFKITGNPKSKAIAREVFLLHPFDEAYKLWKVVNVDGSYRSFDMTFNHQLWFAAAGAMLNSLEQQEDIHYRCSHFLENLHTHCRIYKNGLIKHDLINRITYTDRLRNTFNVLNRTYRHMKSGTSMLYKENGYHLFNMYAFALIKNTGMELDFFNSPLFKLALSYCESVELETWLSRKPASNDCHEMNRVKNKKFNIYGYGYNPPGFEALFIQKVFKPNLLGKIDHYVSKQCEATFNGDTFSFNRNTEDEKILNARLYELVRGLP